MYTGEVTTLKKYLILVLLFTLSAMLVSCKEETTTTCDDGLIYENGWCVSAPPICNDNEDLINNLCVLKPLVCDEGYHL